MNLRVYEKTRYQNIYRHKKNKNYIIQISKPTKTSIAEVNGEKVYKLEDALKIRDNPKIRLQKGKETLYKEDFHTMWDKYIDSCKNEQKLAYNTINQKQKMYNKYLKNNFNKRLSKITKDDVIKFFNNMISTNKQKNQMLKELKVFFNWCVKQDILITNPASTIERYKVEKTEMKFWTPEELSKILKVLDEDINSNNLNDKIRASLIKIFILIGFSLGDRVGETRALTYDSFDERLGIVKIKHSINYDPSSNDFLGMTKNYQSQRNVDVTDKLINEVKKYKQFLLDYTSYDIKDTDIIFFNYTTNRPYSDTTLRKKFYYYCDKANITKIRMYDLRHTNVAIMMSEGKELYYISPRLGHKDYDTTINKYGHLFEKTRKEVASITDKYI